MFVCCHLIGLFSLLGIQAIASLNKWRPHHMFWIKHEVLITWWHFQYSYPALIQPFLCGTFRDTHTEKNAGLRDGRYSCLIVDFRGIWYNNWMINPASKFSRNIVDSCFLFSALLVFPRNKKNPEQPRKLFTAWYYGMAYE